MDYVHNGNVPMNVFVNISFLTCSWKVRYVISAAKIHRFNGSVSWRTWRQWSLPDIRSIKDVNVLVIIYVDYYVWVIFAYNL